MAGDTKSTGVLVLIGVPAVLLTSLFVLVILVIPGTSTAVGCTGGAARVAPDQVKAGAVPGYTAEQLVNAAHIMNAAGATGLDRAAQVVGVMTALGESSLIVLDHGDTVGPDSRGLFQQRDSWGTLADRMNPTVSATLFFAALQTVPDWQKLSPTIAAHKVQRNADPYHYESFFTPANLIVTTLAGGGGCTNGALVFPLSAGFSMTDGYGPRISPVPGASSWHPAVDLQHWPNPCGDQIYSISAGTVVYVGGYQVTIKSPDGYAVTYMHMKLSDVTVTPGDHVTVNQPIALVGTEGPSTGCHLDIRINKHGTTNPAIADLKAGQDYGGPASSYGFVNPEQFYAAFGMELCPTDTCPRRP